jgi:hypothetical protein
MERNPDSQRDNDEVNQAKVRRQGTRRGAGADTPSGPNTDRTPIPAEREEQEKGKLRPDERSREMPR